MEGESGKKKPKPPPLNKFMHPRNPYRTPPSFKKLATIYPKFREFCTYGIDGKVHLDFSNAEALSALATCLLHKDFGLEVDIPKDRLVPTLPLRLNYILWLEDILSLSRSTDKKDSPVIGIDIGAGAACVYPLLGSKKNNWSMIASEINEESYNCAKENILKNKLNHLIHIQKVNETEYFSPLIENGETLAFINKHRNNANETSPDKTNQKFIEENSFGSNYLIDFTMCNPPFFSNEDQTDSMTKTKRQRSKPSSAPTGALHETVVEGGEVAFISSLVLDGLKYKDKIRVFSSLIGSKADVKSVMKVISATNPAHVTTTEFCQGRTMRWGIAWTYDPKILLENITSKKQRNDTKPQTLLIPRSQLAIYSVPNFWNKLKNWLNDIKIKPRVLKNTKSFISASVKAYKPLWQNRRRRRRLNQGEEMKTIKDLESTDPLIKNEKEENNSNEPNSSTNQNAEKRQIDDSQCSANKKFKYDQENINCFSKLQIKDINGKDTDSIPIGELDKEIESKNGSSKDENITKNENDEENIKKPDGLPCLIKCKIHVKMINNQITLEITSTGGTMGKEGTNQLMTYLRNRLKEG